MLSTALDAAEQISNHIEINSHNTTPSLKLITDNSFMALTTRQFLDTRFPEANGLIPGLLHTGDLVTFTGRRRNGKTQFLMNLALCGAVGKDFIGNPIPKPFRTLLNLLEDNAGELQGKVRRMLGNEILPDNTFWLYRDLFLENHIPINAKDDRFRKIIEAQMESFNPDVVVFDNLAHMIGAQYDNAITVHELMDWIYGLSRNYNAAVIIAAHPRKLGDDANPIQLSGNLPRFAEETMGTSHLINSTGSIWGIEKDEDGETTFGGGRQRADGTTVEIILTLDDNGWFQLVEDKSRQLRAVCNSPKRQGAWNLLPEKFRNIEGHEHVKSCLASSNSYNKFIEQCVRRGILTWSPDGVYRKNPSIPGQFPN